MVCTVCGSERPERGTCRSCGSRLCSLCAVVVEVGRKSKYCAGCSSAYNRKWRAANLEKHRENARTWAASNPQRHRENARRWRIENPEKRAEADRKRREVSPDYFRRWREANPDKQAAYGRKWQQSHPEKNREKARKRRALKKGCLVSAVQISRVIEKSSGLCAMCRSYVPEDLRHIDHIVPLGKGGSHSQDNLQLLCYRCNTSKGAKLPEEVAPPQWAEGQHPLQPHLLNPDWK